MTPRGIRNCNPLNIRRTTKDQWKGLAERQQQSRLLRYAARLGTLPSRRAIR